MDMGKTTFLDTRRAMEALVKTATAKAIGVSNFSRNEVQILLERGSAPPAVHQMELHPYPQQKEATQWHRSQGVHLTLFSPLRNQNSFYRGVQPSHTWRVVDRPILAEVAETHGKTPVQVALAWRVNSDGGSFIPKNVMKWQIKENLESDFALDEEDMDKIASMDVKTRFNDPSEVYR